MTTQTIINSTMENPASWILMEDASDFLYR
jgi:hypothetical protein